MAFLVTTTRSRFSFLWNKWETEAKWNCCTAARGFISPSWPSDISISDDVAVLDTWRGWDRHVGKIQEDLVFLGAKILTAGIRGVLFGRWFSRLCRNCHSTGFWEEIMIWVAAQEKIYDKVLFIIIIKKQKKL